MKKIYFLILLVMLPLAASAEIIEKNGIWYKMHHQIAGDVYTAEVIASQGNPYSGDITIPQSIYWGETCPVTSIGESAFEGSTGLTSITIPSSIKSIEQGAFYGCSGLTSVRIPEGVTKIGLGNDFVWPSKCYVKLSFITNGAFYLAMKYKIINFAAE